MATVKKRGPRKRHDPRNLTEGQYRDLVFGWVLDFDGVPFDSQEMRRKCWELHKDEIMLRRGKESSFAYPTFEHGTRPDGWWCYSNKSKEPRKRWKKTISMGSPPGYEVEVDELESQLGYLERTEQLYPDEKRLAIKAKEDKERCLRSMSQVTDLDEVRDSPEVYHY